MWRLAFFLLVGCGRVSFDNVCSECQDGAPPVDVTTCMPMSTECSCWTFVPSNFDPCMGCATGSSPLLLALGTYSYNTDEGTLAGAGMSIAHATGVLAQASGPAVRVIYAPSFVIESGATLNVVGTLPLLIAAGGDVMISGTIIARGDGTTPGPGGNAASCATTGATSGVGQDGRTVSGDIYGGGGGGGGAFGDGGGVAGDGWGVGANGNGGVAGVANGVDTIAPLRGGCAGGKGGREFNGFAGAAAWGGNGGGGGALQIASCGTVALDGTIDVGGGGGLGGHANPSTFASGAGGGGGGSGGALLVEGAMLFVSSNARLCANGGAGGEGGIDKNAGANGAAGTCSTNVAASAADTTPEGGNAGVGGTRLAPSGGAGVGGGVMAGGGGGGGGGVGRIRLRATMRLIDPLAIVSPAPTQ